MERPQRLRVIKSLRFQPKAPVDAFGHLYQGAPAKTTGSLDYGCRQMIDPAGDWSAQVPVEKPIDSKLVLTYPA